MGDYIQDIRAVIGNQTLILAGAAVYVFNDDGQMLMQHRADNGLWSCPGGIVDVDEPVEQTAIREVFEETGLQLTQVHLIGVASGPAMRYVYPNGDDTSNVCCVFSARVPSDAAIQADAESRELRWVDLPIKGIELSPPTAYMMDRFPPEIAIDSLTAG